MPPTERLWKRSIADLKEANRNLLSVYQGTNRMHPMEGER